MNAQRTFTMRTIVAPPRIQGRIVIKSKPMRALFLLLTCCTLLLAQVDSGAISGVVTDTSGAVIPGATVVIVQDETNLKTDLKTNETGFYSAPSLRPGRYQITVTQEGFRAQKSQPIELRVQDRVQMNFQLEVGAATAEIVVSAAAPLLESETSSLGHVVEEKNIVELPLNGRNFIQLATLGAGTLPSTRTAERDNFISNGARAVQNSYLLDGIDNKNRIMGFDKSSAQIVQPIIDAIQEFKVQTSTFSAEFGQAAGGVVNVTMKSGTNNLHGNVFEFLRNSTAGRDALFSAGGRGQAAVHPESVRRHAGRTDHQRPNVFLRQLAKLARIERARRKSRPCPLRPMRQGVFSESRQGSCHQARLSQQHHSAEPLGSGGGRA